MGAASCQGQEAVPQEKAMLAPPIAGGPGGKIMQSLIGWKTRQSTVLANDVRDRFIDCGLSLGTT